jgi:ribosomal protein S16
MPLSDVARGEFALEECLDDITDFVESLGRYPPVVLAVALRVHLETLLQTLLEGGACTRAEVRDFLRELERAALLNEDAG